MVLISVSVSLGFETPGGSFPALCGVVENCKKSPKEMEKEVNKVAFDDIPPGWLSHQSSL